MQKSKIISPADIPSFCENLHKEGAVLVFTNGIFDLLHPGHVHYLDAARRLGTHLLVAVNSDASTRRIKGEPRPLVPLEHRLELLTALHSVSSITWFETDTPDQIIRLVRPDVLVKGGDWETKEIVGKDFVESYGGKVLNIPYIPGYSTSSIIEKILKL